VKKNLKIKKFILYLITMIITSLAFNINLKCIHADENETDVHQAIKEVMYSYYMRGEYIQYNSSKRAGTVRFSPEEATSQNINYMVCSGFTQGVYMDLLNIAIPSGTGDLIEYAEKNFGNSEVIASGKRDDNNNVIMKIYNKEAQENYIELNNPNISELLPYLKPGDILTYTGHTLLIYELIYDANSNVIDAYTLESAHGTSGYYVNTKISNVTNRIGSKNHFLFYNREKNTSFSGGLVEGSLHLSTLTRSKVWKDLTTDEYSILRFVDQDEYGNIILNYQGTDYGDKNHNEEIINLSDKTKSRSKFSKLYIEKTVDVHTDDVVQPNDILTYKIVIRNNSEKNYTEDLIVTENLSEYITYKSYTTSKSIISTNEDLVNNKITWNVGKLSSGEEVIIYYTVVVKENYNGKTIEATGMVDNIPTANIKNTIGYNLTENQANSIIKKYNDLKTKFVGKQLINEIYKQAIGLDLKINNFNIADLIINSDSSSTKALTIQLNEKNELYNMVLNKYYSSLKQSYYTDVDVFGYDLKDWKSYVVSSRRADTIYSENFITGDILIYLNDHDKKYNYNKSTNEYTEIGNITYESGEYAYIFIEGEGFVGINLGNDNVIGTKDDRNEFNYKYYNNNGLNVYSNTNETDENMLEFFNYQSLFGKDYYVILRPSLVINKDNNLNDSTNDNIMTNPETGQIYTYMVIALATIILIYLCWYIKFKKNEI